MSKSTAPVLILIVATLAGCAGSGPQLNVHAPVVVMARAEYNRVVGRRLHDPFYRPGAEDFGALLGRKPAPPAKPRPLPSEARQIAMLARFIELRRGTFGEWGVDPALDVTRLAPKSVTGFIAAVRKQQQGSILAAPRVTVFSGQRAYLEVTTRRSFVRPYNADGCPEIGSASGPTIQMALTATARGESGIELSKIQLVKRDRNIADELREARAGSAATDGVHNDGNSGITGADKGVPKLPPEDWCRLAAYPMFGADRTITLASGESVLIPLPARCIVARPDKDGDALIASEYGAFIRKYARTGYPTGRGPLFVILTAHRIQQEED